jgi:hypothetical protein
MKAVDEVRKRASVALDDAARKCAEVFDYMGSQDYLVVLTGTVKPFLFRLCNELLQIAERSAKAIGRGATICIIAPDQEQTDSFEKQGYSQIERHSDFARGFEQYRRYIFGQLRKTGMTAETAKQVVASRIGQVYTTDCKFFTPGFVFSLFGHTPKSGAKGGEQPVGRVVIRPPYIALTNSILYPPEPLFESRIYNAAILALTQRLAELRSIRGTARIEREEELTFVDRLRALLTADHEVLEDYARMYII